jgi:hypothetical protein
MICPKCQTPNDNTYQFCQECGLNFQDNQLTTNKTFSNTEPKTLVLPSSAVNFETNKDVPLTQYQIPTANLPPPNSGNTYPSDEFQTVVRKPEIIGDIPNSNQDIRKSSKIPLILLGLLSVVLLGVVGYLVIPSLLKKPIILPDHFGLFNKKDEQFSELKMREFTNVLKGRDELKNDSSLIVTESNPNLILFSDGQTIPIADLKLIRLDTIKEDGKIENWEYQVAPVDENSQMKQIRVSAGLPKGKYALAAFKGNFDEGTHKLWAFQVENGAQTPANSQIIALNLKPTPPPTPKPTSTPTPTPKTEDTPVEEDDTEIGTCNENNVVMRRSPVISENNKIGRLDRGEKVEILKYSEDEVTDPKSGITSSFIFVRKKSNGKTGWVFAEFID